jgi:two-component system heavy metal sensor histidine kinase CusS
MMLFLSQADRGAEARREHVASMAGVARTVVELHEAAIEEAGLKVRINGDATGLADVRLLQRALSNLIGNATRHAHPHSTVVVQIDRLDGEIALRVVNEGRRFQPSICPICSTASTGQMQRGRMRRNHGLGLAIVAAIARMHGGRTMVDSSNGITSIRAHGAHPARAIVNGSGTTNRLAPLANYFFQQEKRQKADKEHRRHPGAIWRFVCFDQQFFGHEVEQRNQTKREEASQKRVGQQRHRLQARPRSAARARARP